MAKKYNLKDALAYTSKLEKEISDLDDLDYVLFNKAIKFFTYADDKSNFKRLIDRYRSLVENSDSSDSELKEHTFSFLEFICSGLDNGFIRAWYANKTKEKLKIGKAQKLLREVYSDSLNPNNA